MIICSGAESLGLLLPTRVQASWLLTCLVGSFSHAPHMLCTTYEAFDEITYVVFIYWQAHDPYSQSPWVDRNFWIAYMLL